MSRGLATRWTKHLKTDKEKSEFTARVANSQEVLNVLRNILEDDLSSVDKSMMDKTHYNTEGWAYFQSDAMGTKRTLTKLLDLIPQGTK